jgi:prolyl-tRNA synthetase
MTHGDDSGLKFPPRVAPIQAVIVPISIGDWKENVLPIAQRIETDLRGQGVRVKLDGREEFTPGWKYSEWEMRGVPLRIEIGPRDIKDKQALTVRRDTGQKKSIDFDSLGSSVQSLLEDIQNSMLDQALKFQRENTHDADNYKDFKAIMDSKRGFIKAFWCGDADCEEKIKEETMATIRVIPLKKDKEKTKGKCVYCQKHSDELAYFAKAY